MLFLVLQDLTGRLSLYDSNKNIVAEVASWSDVDS